MSQLPKYNREEFVLVWLEAYRKAEGQKWVAEKIGVTQQAVQQRAYYCRTIGINLPSLKRSSFLTEKRRLNKIINDAIAQEGNM